MRINLVTPFAEKEAAKALGARWDATKKLWYIVDVADLTPFLRWIPDVDAATAPTADTVAPIQRSAGVITTSTIKVQHCGCTVRAWEDCPHTSIPA
jgi:hypothetical protein